MQAILKFCLPWVLIAQLDNLCHCSLGLCIDFHTQITRKYSTTTFSAFFTALLQPLSVSTWSRIQKNGEYPDWSQFCKFLSCILALPRVICKLVDLGPCCSSQCKTCTKAKMSFNAKLQNSTARMRTENRLIKTSFCQSEQEV